MQLRTCEHVQGKQLRGTDCLIRWQTSKMWANTHCATRTFSDVLKWACRCFCVCPHGYSLLSMCFPVCDVNPSEHNLRVCKFIAIMVISFISTSLMRCATLNGLLRALPSIDTPQLRFQSGAWCSAAKQLDLQDWWDPAVVKEFTHDFVMKRNVVYVNRATIP